MKIKEDEWLTDYINALHFTARLIETQSKDTNVADICKAGSIALIHEAILSNIPMEIFNIQRLTGRADAAETDVKDAETIQMETYRGNTRGLIADYAFLCRGFEEFTLKDMVEECSAYLSKIYPDIKNMTATITELFNKDIEKGAIEEIKPKLYRNT